MVRAVNKNLLKQLVPALIILFVAIVPVAVSAQVSSSNYKSDEFFFGIGGDVELSSPNYQAQGSGGALGISNVSSSTSQAFSGFLTPNEPFLEFAITTSTVNLGTLDTATAKTGNANFYVRAYIDGGYTVKTMSQPPTMTSGASHTLSAKTTQGTSNEGTEEFGINLVANTDPASFGSNPSPQPDGTFATGQAATGYGTTNQYKYNAGDTIAQTSGSGWGQTNYTISYIANISVFTPAGSYIMVHDLVVVATY